MSTLKLGEMALGYLRAVQVTLRAWLASVSMIPVWDCTVSCPAATETMQRRRDAGPAGGGPCRLKPAKASRPAGEDGLMSSGA